VSRIQLALNVSDLESAIGFYRAVLGVEPAKVRDGYANFAVADPPLKLVLIERADVPGGTLNHLGIEVTDTGQVHDATARLRAAGLPVDERTAETCCYATQDKVWVHDPDGARGRSTPCSATPTSRPRMRPLRPPGSPPSPTPACLL
jgi:catechol 2,3-dioxygenase-like lactoylglutathione lyase family enzyme